MAKTTSKIIKTIPNTENGTTVTNTTLSGDKYLITRCLEKQRFTLWKILSEGYEKLATATSPLELYNKIPWFD